MSDAVTPVDVETSRSAPTVLRTSCFVPRTFLWLLLAALPVYFLALGANSVWDANEAFYVDTPRQMVESGNYVTPYFNGTERLNKPVLSYWIVAGLYSLFGVSVAVERLGIALGAMGIIAATFLIGRGMRSTLVGVIAALMVATAPRMVMFSRRIFIDIYVTMFMAMALACLVMAIRRPHRRRLWLIGMYVAIGLGVLTKGPVAAFFPVLVWAVWVVVDRRWVELRHMLVVPGIFIVLAIVVPWYAALHAVHGWGPIVQFFVGENVGRYTGELTSEGRGVLFYLPVLFGDLFPWAPLLLLPIVSAWRRAEPGEDATSASIRRLLWLWIVVIVAVFSLSQSKQDLYIFPVIPAVAVLVADVLVGARFGRDDRRLTVLLGAVAVLTVVSGVACLFLFGSGYYQVRGAALLAAVCVAGGAGMLVWLGRGRHLAAVILLAGTFVAFNYLFVARALPSVERLKPAVPLAEILRDQAGTDGRVGSYHVLFPSLVYYLGRPIQDIGSVDQARDFFTTNGPAWAIMSQAHYDELLTVVPGLCVTDRRPLFEAKLGDLMSRRPSDDVLLVSNRCSTN